MALHAIHKAALQKVLSSRLIPTQLTYNNATLSSVLYVIICWLGFPEIDMKLEKGIKRLEGKND